MLRELLDDLIEKNGPIAAIWFCKKNFFWGVFNNGEGFVYRINSSWKNVPEWSCDRETVIHDMVQACKNNLSIVDAPINCMIDAVIEHLYSKEIS